MKIAQKIIEECMLNACPSSALDECNEESSREQDWDNETTTYIFKDGSKIKDCNGRLEIVQD